MKLYLSLLTCVPLMLSQRGDPRLPSSPSDLCEAILRVPVITERRFDTGFVDKPVDPSWIRLDAEGFQALHDRRMTDSDTAWAIGKITIRGSRIGLLALNSSPECDHAVRYLTLTLFNGCSKLPHWFSLVENDSHVGIYERNAYLVETNDTLIVSVNSGESGEWGVDTVYTRTDRILLAPVVDTLSTETGFEIRE